MNNWSWFFITVLLLGILSGIFLNQMNESFFNYQNLRLHPATLDHHMGAGVPYSTGGYKLRNTADAWDYLYDNPEFKNKRKFTVIQGTPPPLQHEERESTIPDDSMFVLANHIASPHCCPSTFSTSTGCVCLPSSTQKLLSGRSANNTCPIYPGI